VADAPLLDVDIIGLRELRARLTEATGIVRMVMAERGASLSESAKLVYRIHAPVGKDDPLGRARTTPHLRDSIDAELVVTESGMVLTVSVPPEQADKVRFLREGTRAHPIDPRGPWLLHFWWERMGVEVWTPHVEHPGTRANPWEEQAATVVEALVHEAGLQMGEAIARAI
jgi:hypothetical protein